MSAPTKTTYDYTLFTTNNAIKNFKQQRMYLDVITKLKSEPCQHCNGTGFQGLREDVGHALMVAIEKTTGLSWELVTSKSQHRPFCHARAIIAAYLRCNENLSLPVIGRILGRRDHTTVINMIDTHNALHDTEPLYRENYRYFVELVQKETPNN